MLDWYQTSFFPFHPYFVFFGTFIRPWFILNVKNQEHMKRMILTEKLDLVKRIFLFLTHAP